MISKLRDLFLSVTLVSLAAFSALAVEPGKAVGTVTFDGVATTLAFAAETAKENLFDSAKKDTIVILTDHPLAGTSPDDDVELTGRAERGELVVLTLRIDGSKLVNVGVNHKGITGTVLLPGQWFGFTSVKKSAGALKLGKREWDGHSYACTVDFAAAPVTRPRITEATAEITIAPTPTLLPATTSNIDRKASTALLVAAMMNKDTHQALELIKLGADPNGRDPYGIPVLNWAVMMCQGEVVKALLDAKASLTYERAPGLTIMQEAGACPAAAKILKAAGAK